MPFNFCVTPTVNGAPETITFRDVPDERAGRAER
jgi:hypothetical protein